jgi:hypothetical protein
MRTATRGWWAVAGALAAAACAEQPPAPGAPKEIRQLALAPYATHEECADIVHGDRFAYRFVSSAPVAFDIRYRERSLVVTPISRVATVSEAGFFAPAVANRYCLAWEAGGAGATIDYTVEIRHPTR